MSILCQLNGNNREGSISPILLLDQNTHIRGPVLLELQWHFHDFSYHRPILFSHPFPSLHFTSDSSWAVTLQTINHDEKYEKHRGPYHISSISCPVDIWVFMLLASHKHLMVNELLFSCLVSWYHVLLDIRLLDGRSWMKCVFGYNKELFIINCCSTYFRDQIVRWVSKNLCEKSNLWKAVVHLPKTPKATKAR